MSGLLLDDFAFQKSKSFFGKVNEDNSLVYMVLLHYTGLLKSCDVGINKSWKDRLKKPAAPWRRAKHSQLGLGDQNPAPKLVDLML